MGYGTIRISDAARGTLRELARAEGKSMLALLDEAVEALRRQRFLEQVNAAYAALRDDPRAWEGIQAERREWDVTTDDGLLAAEGRTPYKARSRASKRRKAGRRPALVVSEDLFNRGPAGLVIVLPMTSTLRNVPSHVPVDPPEGGVKHPTAILCEAVRSISSDRLIARWGAVERQTMTAVEDRLRILMRL
jgi:mRNA interferase MazF